MTSYNCINGEAVSGSKYLLNDILREEMGFDGVVVSDYSSISEMHDRQNMYENLEAAGLQALIAGVDQELPSKKCYNEKLKELFESKKIDISILDNAVKRILEKKFSIGLFDNPYAFKS